GIIPEEYAVEYVADRVETTSTVWLGLTVGCARCHSHKYDPLTQKEYYQLFAFFNNINDRGRYFKYGNTPPLVPAPTPDEQQTLARAEAKLATAEKTFADLAARIAKARLQWENAVASNPQADYMIERGQARHFSLDKEEKPVAGVTYVSGRYGNAASFNGKSFLDIGKIRDY
ncbi:MAG: DUF1549 domain-containing protein, partial [Planctomyces sp.]|nr:DUF1549 domain-containing protein [Planctomyces sp.]